MKSGTNKRAQHGAEAADGVDERKGRAEDVDEQVGQDLNLISANLVACISAVSPSLSRRSMLAPRSSSSSTLAKRARRGLRRTSARCSLKRGAALK